MPKRGPLGPLIVAAAAWCAAGVLTIASPEGASHRFAVPAPWWVFAAALVVAACVPAWRRRPLTAAPALLATLPWWPVPLPPVALIWTGPLAWLPIAAAFVCAVGVRPLTRIGTTLRAGEPRRAAWMAAVLTLAACAVVAWRVDSRVPGGDEPHYLVITQSLLNDGDLKIENNHRQRDYAAYFGGTINPDYVKRGSDGEIYSIHAPGVSALVLPAFALFGYRGAEIFLLLLAALTGGLVWRIAWALTDDASASWFAWAAVAGSSPFLLHSFTVFPDPPAALFVAASVLLLVRLHRVPQNVGVAELVVVSALLAALPWLHTRFAVLAGGFGLLIVLAAGRARAATFAVIPAASAVAWFAFFQLIYGTPDPTVPYGGGAGTRAAFVPGGLTGLFFDEQFGLIVHAPVLVLAGAWLLSAKVRRVECGALAVSGVYLVAVATYWLWWAGTPASPGRFTVAVLPTLALPLAQVWRAADADRRRLCLLLLAVSIAISAVLVGVNDGALAWNMRDAQAAWLEWLGPVVNLPRAWPSFFWKLDPARLSTELPFAMHAAVWLAVFVGGWMATRQLALRGAAGPESRRAAISVWLLAGVMGAAQAGWWLNGVSGLDAARSQSRVLASAGTVVEIAPLRVRTRADVSNALVLRTEEPVRLEGTRPWLVLDAVPAGTYNLRISTPRPRAGELTVRVGRNALPIRTFPIQSLNRQTEVLELPVGVRGITVVPSPSLEGISGTIDLQPVRVERGGVFARLVASYGPARVYFFDDRVDAEAGGFWVHGGASAALAIQSAHDGGGVSSLSLQNGRGDNEVIVDVDGTTTRERFGSFETKHVPLPVSSSGVRRLTITSTSGFRPSDDGVSTDSRYLGVWVEVK